MPACSIVPGEKLRPKPGELAERGGVTVIEPARKLVADALRGPWNTARGDGDKQLAGAMHCGHDAVSRLRFVGDDDKATQAFGVGGNERVEGRIVGGRNDERCIADCVWIVHGELNEYLLINRRAPHQLLADAWCPDTDRSAARRESEGFARCDRSAAHDKREHRLAVEDNG